MKGLLIGAGAVFVVIGIWNWFWIENPQPSTVEETLTEETIEESTAPTETVEESQTEELKISARLSRTTSEKTTNADASSKTTVKDPSDKTTKTTAAPSSRRSETLTLGLLGFGFALLLAGAFFDRISAIKFPGGEITLADATDDLEKAVADLQTSQAEIKKGLESLARKLVRK